MDDAWPPGISLDPASAKNFILQASMWRIFRSAALRSGVLLGLQFAFQVAMILLTEQYLRWFQDNSLPWSTGWMLIFMAGICMFLGNAVCGNHGIVQVYLLGMDARSLCSALVYRKLMHPRSVQVDSELEKFVAFLSVHCERLPVTVLSLHYFWLAPLNSLVCSILLLLRLGPAALSGILILLLTVPQMMVLMGFQKKQMLSLIPHRHARLAVIRDGVHGFKVLKYFSWELAFGKKVELLNSAAERGTQRAIRLQTLSAAIAAAIVASSAIAVVTGSILSDARSFTPASMFTAIALLGLMRHPLSTFPASIQGGAELKCIFSRLQDILLIADDGGQCSSLGKGEPPQFNNVGGCGYIEIGTGAAMLASPPVSVASPGQSRSSSRAAQSRSSSRASITEILCLDRVIAQVQQEYGTADAKGSAVSATGGQLCAVVGGRRSGKSALLRSLAQAGDGDIQIKGSVAYCSQGRCLFRSSIKENILFGLPFDEARYKETIDMCALADDLVKLPNGDLTELFESEDLFTGSLQTRIALARATYSDAAIFILDELFMALDAEICQLIFERCIQPLATKGKLVILAMCLDKTRPETQLLPSMDSIWVMHGSQIVETGTYDDLRHKPRSKLRHQFTAQSMTEEEKVQFVAGSSGTSMVGVVARDEDSVAMSLDVLTSCSLLLQGASMCLDCCTTSCPEGLSIPQHTQSSRLNLGRFLFVTYFGGVCSLLTLFLLLVATQAAVNASDWLLANLSNMALRDSTMHTNNDFYRYISFALAALIIALLRSCTLSELLLHSHRRNESNMLKRVMLSRIDSLGHATQIIKTLGTDMDQLSTSLQNCLPGLLIFLFQVVGLSLTIACTIPLMIPALFLIAGYVGFLQHLFLPAMQQLLCLDMVTRQVLRKQMSGSLTCLSTIHTYGHTQHFLWRCMERLDLSSAVFLSTHGLNGWLRMNAEALGTLLLIAAGCVAMHGRDGHVSPGIAALVMLYAQSLPFVLASFFRLTVETESTFPIVECLKQYLQLDQEAPLFTRFRPPSMWPKSGKVEFKDIVVCRSQGSPRLLPSISFIVESGMKVGICGSKGSSKTSLLNVLFRILDVHPTKGRETNGRGQVLLDDLDVGSVGLSSLRKVLSILPEMPMLFAGSIRQNVDFLEERTEEELCSAIKQAHFSDVSLTLETQVGAGGRNLTPSQRQLVCLARAIVKSPKVFCVDEICKDVDSSVEAITQEVIETKFESDTVLLVADGHRRFPPGSHAEVSERRRLRAIARSDRVLFMQDGRALEYDTPARLLALHETGKFSNLVKDMEDPLAEKQFKLEALNQTFDVAPITMKVRALNGQQECSGVYTILMDELPNGRPVWKQDDGERWLYCSNFGTWTVGGILAKEKNFDCSTGWLYNKAQGISQPNEAPGQWVRWSNGRFIEDRTVTVVADGAQKSQL